MKRLFAVLVSLVLGLCLGASLVACSKNDDAINIYVPDGAPAFAIAGLMHENAEIGGKKVNYTVVDPSTISTYLQNGSADFAIVPTNTAANAFNKGMDYRVAAAVTHGNLYIVGKTEVSGDTIEEKLAALKGKKLGIIGQAGTPNMMFKYIVDFYDIDFNIYNSDSDLDENEISVTYHNNGQLAMGSLKSGQTDFALLGEPAVAAAKKNIEGSEIVFDLCDIWEDITGGNRYYPQAVLVAKGGMDSALTKQLVEKMKESEQWAETNPDEALEAISNSMLEGAATTITMVSKEIVKNCNIIIIPSSNAKADIIFYLDAIKTIDTNAIGGKMPSDEFYLELAI